MPSNYGSDALNQTLIQTGGEVYEHQDRFAGLGDAFQEGADKARETRITENKEAREQETHEQLMEKRGIEIEDAQIEQDAARVTQAEKLNVYKQNLIELTNRDGYTGPSADDILQSRKDVADGISTELIDGAITEEQAQERIDGITTFNQNLEGGISAFMKKGENGFVDENDQKLMEVLSTNPEDYTLSRDGNQTFATWTHPDGTEIKRDISQFDGTGAGFGPAESKVGPRTMLANIGNSALGKKINETAINGANSDLEISQLETEFMDTVIPQISDKQAASMGEEIAGEYGKTLEEFDADGNGQWDPEEVAQMLWTIQTGRASDGKGLSVKQAPVAPTVNINDFTSGRRSIQSLPGIEATHKTKDGKIVMFLKGDKGQKNPIVISQDGVNYDWDVISENAGIKFTTGEDGQQINVPKVELSQEDVDKFGDDPSVQTGTPTPTKKEGESLEDFKKRLLLHKENNFKSSTENEETTTTTEESTDKPQTFVSPQHQRLYERTQSTNEKIADFEEEIAIECDLDPKGDKCRVAKERLKSQQKALQDDENLISSVVEEGRKKLESTISDAQKKVDEAQANYDKYCKAGSKNKRCVGWKNDIEDNNKIIEKNNTTLSEKYS